MVSIIAFLHSFLLELCSNLRRDIYYAIYSSGGEGEENSRWGKKNKNVD